MCYLCRHFWVDYRFIFRLFLSILQGRSVPRKQPTSSVKYRGSPGGGEGGGKPRRMRPGEKALKEIRFYQRHTGNDHVITRICFSMLAIFHCMYVFLILHLLFNLHRAINTEVAVCKISQGSTNYVQSEGI